MTDDQLIRQQLQALYDKLAKFHWSPAHPSTYVITHPDNGKTVGIGIIAMRDPGAFNLVYAAVNGALATLKDQQVAVTLFTSYDALTKLEVDKQALASWLTLLNEAEFKEWIYDARNHGQLPTYDVLRICEALKLSTVRKI